MTPLPTTAIVMGFTTIPLGMVALLVLGVGVASARSGAAANVTARRVLGIAAALAAWMTVFATLAEAGVLARFDAKPPPFLLLMVAVLVGALALARSRIGALLARHLPLALLVAAQGFRLPLELLMHAAAGEGVIPAQMTWTGANFDILSGASALAVAVLVAMGIAGRRVVAIWNAVCGLLLANIVVIAMISTPAIHAFGTEPARLNTFVAYFPFVWLPTVLVAFAIAGQLIVWRALLAAKAAPSPT